MRFQSLFRFAGWPVITGILFGMVILLWLGREPSQPRTDTADEDPTPRFHFGDWSPGTEEWVPVSYSDAVANAAPAVVNIYTQTSSSAEQRAHPRFKDPLFQHYYNNFGPNRQQRMLAALGSGVIMSSDGYILTNNHLISGAEQILVLLQDGREAQAQLIGSDPDSDLAVLKIELPNLTTIEIGSPTKARIGDVVLAIGNPYGVGQTVTQGILSATGRYGVGINTYENYLQTDAAINPGNSGGALIDTQGNLLGINTAILDQQGAAVGIGFAIPADSALKVMQDLVDYGQVVRGWLGIEAQELSTETATTFNLHDVDGVLVKAIYNNGPAHLAGLRPGDIILKINDSVISDGRLSRLQIAGGRPGDKVKIEFLRNGHRETVIVILGVKPTTT